jgi:integrase
VATTGNDPELDSLLLRLHTETACRRGGALALRLRDLDVEQCLVRLREKGETVRWQPVTPTLMRHLLDHAEQRGATDPEEQILRYRNSAPITARRYDHLWQRIGQHLPWVAAQQIGSHWLRHTTLTWVSATTATPSPRPTPGIPARMTAAQHRHTYAPISARSRTRSPGSPASRIHSRHTSPAP